MVQFYMSVVSRVTAIAVMASMFFMLFVFPISMSLLAGFSSEARTIVEELGLPDDAREVSAIYGYPAEGTAPEMAARTFRTAMPEGDVQAFYDDRCDALDMTAPPGDWLRHSPEMICVRSAADPADARVYLYADCDATACLVTIEVRY